MLVILIEAIANNNQTFKILKPNIHCVTNTIHNGHLQIKQFMYQIIPKYCNKLKQQQM